jgi:AraC-like DNA-binding protein
MTETLFTFDERNYRQCQDGYRGEREQEYYLGDYRIEGGATVEVTAQKKSVGATSIILLRSKNRLHFQRAWAHIREDATDVTVLWFVRCGALSITWSGGTVAAGEGGFVATRSMQPFTMECSPAEGGCFEVLHVIVPSHVFRALQPVELKTAALVPGDEPAPGVAYAVLSELFESDDAISEYNQQKLMDAALSVAADALGQRADCLQVRRSLREERLREVLRYIDIHLCDPGLSAAKVARGSGISARYLSTLLRENGTPFSELVWGARVKAAEGWLARTTAEDVSIAEIAFRVGFKSAAHFSRMFKRVYNVGPREYRNACQQRTAGIARSRSGSTPLYLAARDGEVSKQY